MSDQKEESGKFKIFFQNGLTKIFDGFTVKRMQEVAREEDEETPVADLVKITNDFGGIQIPFR